MARHMTRMGREIVMQPIIVLLVGLQGSGKSELSETLACELEPCDAFHDFLASTYDGVFNSLRIEELTLSVSRGRNCILNEVTGATRRNWSEPRRNLGSLFRNICSLPSTLRTTQNDAG